MAILSNIRIGLRLGASFLVILLLLVGISMVALIRMKEQALASERIINHDVNRVIQTNIIKSQAQKAALTLLQILPTPERSDRIALYKVMDNINKQLDETLVKVTDSYGQALPSQLTELISLRQIYSDNFLETVEYVEADTELAIEHYNDETKPALEALLTKISSFEQFELSRMNSEQSASELANANAQRMMILLAVIAFIAGAFLAIAVSRSIVNPIEQAVAFARKIAQGDLSQQPVEARRDEIGELNDALSEMRDGLFTLISIKLSSLRWDKRYYRSD